MYIVLAVAVVAVMWAVMTYNSLIKFRVRAKEGLSDIEVQLKRRHDLIPNLVETVKGYMQHEKDVFEKVTQARAAAMGASNAKDRVVAENALSNTLKTLFAVSENYPELKANANFLDLQREIADTENKIQAARRFYNGLVRDLNTAIETFPSKLIADWFHFGPEEFFDLDETPEERENVQVKF